jgi:hypothetical protein
MRETGPGRSDIPIDNPYLKKKDATAKPKAAVEKLMRENAEVSHPISHAPATNDTEHNL